MAQLIKTPHDLFIRSAWERKEDVISFLENHLPIEVRDCLNHPRRLSKQSSSHWSS
jgi:hypothetical protein